MTPANYLAGKFYNWRRFPQILATAAAIWDRTHVKTGSDIKFLTIFVPNSGGTRKISVTAVPMGSFRGQTETGVAMSSTDAVSHALWLSQFKDADWNGALTEALGGTVPANPPTIPVHATISIEVNNGTAIVAAPPPHIRLTAQNVTQSPKGSASMSGPAYINLATATMNHFSSTLGLSAPKVPDATSLAVMGADAPTAAPTWWQKTLFTLPNASKTPVTVAETGVVSAALAIAAKFLL
jgi:hypothetical protein